MKAQVLRLSLPVCILSALTGCAMGPLTPAPHSSGNRITGTIHGGQQPVVGSTIRLYTVGTTGDASASSQLLTQAVTTDANGTFTITGDYSCASATEVYLTATGGNPGLSTPNPNLLMMAALGSCTALTPNTFITINELTTVAAAYALAPYASSATSIGAGSSDAAALAGAFTLANEYVNTTTGQAPGTGIPSGYTDPTALLNTLADILASCVNTAGGVANDHATRCGSLFALTPSSTGAAPTDTFTAALNLANNPGLQTAAIFNLSSPTGPFQPTLTQPPSDFNVRLTAAIGQGALQIQPGNSLAFSDEPVNGPSEAGLLSIYNSSLGDVTITSLQLIGPAAADFAFVAVTCPPGNLLSVRTSEVCSVDLAAQASALGERLAYLRINSTAPDSPNYVKLYLSGTNVQTTPSYFYVSTAGELSVYSASTLAEIGSKGGTEYYGAVHYDYVGNFYEFGQVVYSDSTVGPFVINTNDFGHGFDGPAPDQSFNPVPPGQYLFNSAATSLTGATSSFAADNQGRIYIPVRSTETQNLAIAVYPPDSTGPTLPSFLLYGYGGKVAVDPQGDLFTLDSTGTIFEYQFGVNQNSTPVYNIPLTDQLGTGPNARVIDIATDAASNVYALIYGINGYEVDEYINLLSTSGRYELRNYIYGSSSQLNQPTAMAVDGQGDIFVADISPTTQKKVVLLYRTNGSVADQTPDAVIDASHTDGPVTTGLAVR